MILLCDENEFDGLEKHGPEWVRALRQRDAQRATQSLVLWLNCQIVRVAGFCVRILMQTVLLFLINFDK